MNLHVQFQTLVVSFMFGLFYGLGYGFFNRVFLKAKHLRYILDALFNITWISIYFYTMLYINNGIFILYHYVMLVLGVVFYLRFLATGYLRLVEKVTWLFLPFDFINKKIRDILSHIKWVRKHGDKKNTTKSK